MSRDRIAGLERAWQESGSTEAKVSRLLERRRHGELPEVDLELAAALGDPAACAILGGDVVDEAVPADPRTWDAWYRSLKTTRARIRRVSRFQRGLRDVLNIIDIYGSRKLGEPARAILESFRPPAPQRRPHRWRLTGVFYLHDELLDALKDQCSPAAACLALRLHLRDHLADRALAGELVCTADPRDLRLRRLKRELIQSREQEALEDFLGREESRLAFKDPDAALDPWMQEVSEQGRGTVKQISAFVGVKVRALLDAFGALDEAAESALRQLERDHRMKSLKAARRPWGTSLNPLWTALETTPAGADAAVAEARRALFHAVSIATRDAPAERARVACEALRCLHRAAPPDPEKRARRLRLRDLRYDDVDPAEEPESDEEWSEWFWTERHVDPDSVRGELTEWLTRWCYSGSPETLELERALALERRVKRARELREGRRRTGGEHLSMWTWVHSEAGRRVAGRLGREDPSFISFLPDADALQEARDAERQRGRPSEPED